MSITADGSPRVVVDPDGPAVAARLAVRTTRERVQLAIAERQPAVVVFERGDREQPLIVGFLERLEARRRSRLWRRLSNPWRCPHSRRMSMAAASA